MSTSTGIPRAHMRVCAQSPLPTSELRRSVCTCAWARGRALLADEGDGTRQRAGVSDGGGGGCACGGESGRGPASNPPAPAPALMGNGGGSGEEGGESVAPPHPIVLSFPVAVATAVAAGSAVITAMPHISPLRPVRPPWHSASARPRESATIRTRAAGVADPMPNDEATMEAAASGAPPASVSGGWEDGGKRCWEPRDDGPGTRGLAERRVVAGAAAGAPPWLCDRTPSALRVLPEVRAA